MTTVFCSHSEMVDIEKVIPNPKNPNKHPNKQIDLLAKIIAAQGWRAPITVSKRSGFIVRGHGRLLAARKLGLAQVPVDYQDYESEAAEWADLIADNRLSELSDPDVTMLQDLLQEIDPGAIDMELTAYTADEIEAMMNGDAKVVEDDFDAGKALDEIDEPTTNLGDIYLLGNHRLMCGDSTDAATVGRLMDGQKADMVFTDPPYGVDYSGGIQFTNAGVKKESRQRIKGDSTDDIYTEVIPIIASICNGPCYVWFADTKAGKLYDAVEAVGEIHSLIIWVKNGGYAAMNANYKQKHEPCLYWKPRGKKLNFVGATTETTIWNIDKDGLNKFHPTQKPVSLASRAIGNHSVGLVLDLFGGSGSTLIACEQLDRRCYMMELDPKYCDVIVKRWETLTGNKAELLRR